jgi:hypothetical protein
MAPWRLDGLVEDRVARCRAQLQERVGPNAGSADMQVYVEYADLIVALHRTALDDDGRPRQRLSPGMKLQARTPHCDPAAPRGLLPSAPRAPRNPGVGWFWVVKVHQSRLGAC